MNLGQVGSAQAQGAQSQAANIPALPPGVSLEENARKAQGMSPLEFYRSVKTGGIWDYKKKRGKFEDGGNFNFGVLANAYGIPEEIAKMDAGAYQIDSGTSTPEWGGPRPGYLKRSAGAFTISPFLGLMQYGANKYGGVFTSPSHGDDQKIRTTLDKGTGTTTTIQ